MDIVYSNEEFESYFREAVVVSPEHPILIDKFLEYASRLTWTPSATAKTFMLVASWSILRKPAIHSGDSACVLPPHTIPKNLVQEIERQTEALARELDVIGLMNIQFAIKDDEIYIIEVNPRASRTVPFVSKATGVPLAKLATRVMLGEKLKDLKPWEYRKSGYCSVKEAVFPFNRFPGVDVLLGPEMRSTGEVMGIADTFGMAYMKAQLAAGQRLPLEGTVFISINDRDKQEVFQAAEMMSELGFNILATKGTAEFLRERGAQGRDSA